MSATLPSKAALAALAFGVGNLVYLDFVLAPAFLRVSSNGAVAGTHGDAHARATKGARTRIARAEGSDAVGPRTWVVFFDRGEKQPTRASEAAMTAALTTVLATKAHLRIEGHTDGVGPADFNKMLSAARADAVAAWLIARGVPADRIRTFGYGELRPRNDRGKAAPNQDRRVEIVLEDR